MNHLNQVLWRFVGVAAVASLLPVLWFVWEGLVEVRQSHIAILIRKTGIDLPDGAIAAPSPDHKGIQAVPLPEGWHFLNPYTWETRIVPQIEIPGGKVGILTRYFGDNPPPGVALARKNEKGIVPEILKPGRYAINTLLHGVELYDAVNIPAGHVGVVTRVTGPEPEEPNQFVVEAGERGVQPKTLPPGTEYLNPYDQRVCPVDMRSHRFDMADKHVVEFLSKDGFQITMEASVEWLIDPSQVAKVYVEYVDSRIMGEKVIPGEAVIECIVEKVILPNARAFSRIEGSRHEAQQFISGVTRQNFQNHMLTGLKEACAKQGIVIKSALVRKTEPPREIADPIRQREIAIRQREKLEQDMEREKQQKLNAITTKLHERVKMKKATQADVAVAITEAMRHKEVAVIEASRKLAVAQLELDATRNQAEAKKVAGEAAAQVVKLRNAAEASAIRNARLAFGDGDQYVRYLFLKKVAPAMREVVSNTDGPFVEMFKPFALPPAAEGKGSK